MLGSIFGFPFSLDDERFSTLTRLQDIFGKSFYTLRAISHDATTNPLAVTPNDPNFGAQWHLNGANGINPKEVWEDYRGGGITIGFVDDGMQYTHPDLAGNYNTGIDYDLQTNTPDGAPRTSSDKHGTTTGGVAAAVGNNALGVTGVAYEADLANFRLPFGTNLTDAQFATLYIKQLEANVDVSNNSWGFGGFFEDDFVHTLPELGDAIENLAIQGRGGLGANVVFSAGNGRTEGQNTNYHNVDNSQYTIAVAATDQNGKFTSFSTPGATVLTSAPGTGIVSTDRTGSDGYVSTDYVSGLAGTSYSAPIVSGIVALMLDANPDLGYRDVQEILAYSSRNSDPFSSGWAINGATNFNGGGMHFSHDYGFGLADAQAAVRLAETWDTSHTYANRDMVNGGTDISNASITDNNATGISRFMNVSSNLDIDRVEVDVNIAHPNIGDLILKLTSPSGMVSTLVNRPGVTSGFFGAAGSGNDNIHFTLGSNAFWGETGNGQWKLQVIDARGGNAGTLADWSLRLYGDDGSADDTYVYTNEYSEMRAALAARGTLSDTGGSDTLNLAAVKSNITLSLVDGAGSTVDGVALMIAASTLIENARLGDGDDAVTGNAAANFITGGRGNDTVAGAAGDDALDGGDDSDTAVFGGLFSEYAVNVLNGFTLSITDNEAGNGNDGADTLSYFENLLFADGLYLFDGSSVTPPPPPPPNGAPDAQNDAATLNWNTSVTLNVLANDTDPENDALSVTGIAGAPDHGAAVINANNTITYTPTAGYIGADDFSYTIGDGHGNSDTAIVTLTINEAVDPNLNIKGTKNNDTLNGGGGNDTISGDRGNDLMDGKAGNDSMDGGYGNDTMDGGIGNDTLLGGYHDDVLRGDDGNDTLKGDRGTNILTGGAGTDTLVTSSVGTDRFVYEHLSDAGDIIQGFKRGQDKIDLHPLMVEIGYGGTNPVADGHMILTPAAGGDLQLSIDADGPGGNAPVLLTTLDNLNATTLTLGTDYVI